MADPTVIDPINQLITLVPQISLTGACIIAVVALWRDNQRIRQQNVQDVKEMIGQAKEDMGKELGGVKAELHELREWFVELLKQNGLDRRENPRP